MSSSGPSGRSPFPGRSRRRLSAEDDSNFASPLLMSSLLSQSRLSPATASAWSPANSTRSRPRRFFDSDRKQDGGVLATAIPSASMGNPKQPNGNAQQQQHLDGINLTQLRALAKNSLATAGVGATAVFLSSCLFSKTHLPEDAQLYARALAANGEHLRAVRLLERTGLFTAADTQTRLEAVLLAAQSLIHQNEWSEALALLESATGPLEDDDDAGWQALVESCTAEQEIHPVARLCLLRGRGYDETSHATRAALHWKRSLKIDPNCVEALDSLLGRNMLTPQETYDLISSLEMQEWLKHLYLARVHVPAKDERPPLQDATDENNQKMPAKASIEHEVTDAFDKLWTVHKLEKAPEALAVAAVRAHRQYDFKAALKYCQELTEIDPLCPAASFVYVATLVALDHKRLLFQLAHEWVEASPQAAHAWFAVGSYYYACERYHVAQRHYCRATRLDPQCTEAWIAFGCSFSMCDESDQALASFRAAQRLAPAHYAPLLYMGMEYLRTNHIVLARHFLMAASKASAGDPLCLHELGVADYQRGEYATAMVWFTRALRAVDDPNDAFWEPTLFNLGQCHRKLGQFAEAQECFERCMALCPGNASCFSALAFTKHLRGDIDGAIELYHQALSRKPEDSLCSEMLNRALQEALSVKVEEEDSHMTESYPTPEPRFASLSFRSPNDPAFKVISSRRTRNSMRGQTVLDKSEADDNLSDDSNDMDTSMS